MKKCKRKKSCPSWAAYKATDKDGFTLYYEHKPILSASGVWSFWGKVEYAKAKVNCKKNAKKSIRKIKG